jgi:hypothetical protein
MDIDLEATTAHEPEVNGDSIASRLTIEHALYGAVILIGVITRLLDLGKIPLSPAEAIQALAIWNAWQPGVETMAIVSPAYHAFTSPLTQLLGFSDSVMRLVPSIFGVAMILLPWWLRNFTGRLGALVAALLIAVSPIFVISSRTVGGTSIALFAGLLLFVGWLNFQSSNSENWFYIMGFALGLGLASSPLFYSILVTLGAAWLGQKILGPSLFKDELGNRRPSYRPDPGTLRNSALIALGTFLFVGSGFLLSIGGIGGAARIFAEWITAFFGPVAVQDWLRPLSAIIRYELIVVVIGGMAIIWATWRGKSFPMMLLYWFAAALILLFLQRSVMTNTLVLALAGFLLTGTFVDAVFRVKTGSIKWLVALVVALLGSVIYVNLGRFSRLLASDIALDVRTRGYHILLIIVAVAVILIVLAILWSSERRAAVQGLLVGLLVLLVGYSWSTAIWLGTEAANDPREPWVQSASDDDIRLLTSTIQQVSWQVKGSEVDLDIFSTIDNPSLNWYLREMKGFELGDGISPSLVASGLLTEVIAEPQLATEYFGIELGYSRPESDYPLTPSQLLAWWLFHDAQLPIIEDRLIFWLQADLAGVN